MEFMSLDLGSLSNSVMTIVTMVIVFNFQIFTAAPPLVLGLFDRHCSAEIMIRFPALYKSSQNSELFNVKIFWFWILNSIYHSILLFWLPVLMLHQGEKTN